MCPSRPSRIVLAAVLVAAVRCDRPARESAAPAAPAPAAAYAGANECARCHQGAWRDWRGSHHDLAMQAAEESTVLGDFDDATFTHFGRTTIFFRRGGRFWVQTDGPDGELAEYEIAYTFGVEPLQQYLIELPGGRLQALSICWDTRPAAAGGERWFHLYPDEPIPFDDPLHWTGPNQNWNFMCAECHSTNLRKNYDLEEDRYETTWSELDVACEACHGPGSGHVAWAERSEPTRNEPAMGLVVRMGDRDDGGWRFADGEPIARRIPSRSSHLEIETCARCHARRSLVSEEYVHGRPLLDTHRVALLEERLYYADGQILEEVYVYGSFLQSRMYRAGVTCSDCHDPHRLEIASGNGVCLSCHRADHFDTPEHHFHELDRPGSSCVDCHMPAKVYMGVDARRDHSFRVPRPDLTTSIEVPNACTGCHLDRSPQWAAEAIDGHRGTRQRPPRHYGETIAAARRAEPESGRQLAELVGDPDAPGIARATAAFLLQRFAGAATLPAIEAALGDDDPLVRLGALAAAELVEPRRRVALVAPLLVDPLRSVRAEAARVLVAVPGELLSADGQSDLEIALGDLRSAATANAERPEGHLDLGWLHTQRGELEAAEGEYRTALRLDPSYAPARANLADLYRLLGREEEGESVLRQGLAMTPGNGDLHHALGLLLIRRQRRDEALSALARAADLRPDEPRYAFVHAVALDSLGRGAEAVTILEAAHRRHPGDRDLLLALATISRDRDDRERALRYARRLRDLAPGDAGVAQLVAELEAAN